MGGVNQGYFVVTFANFLYHCKQAKLCLQV